MPAEMTSKPFPVACFAPPLTDDLIARYAALAGSLPDSRGDVRDAMRECLAAVRLWWELPESKGGPKDQSVEVRHRGAGTLVKLVSLTPDLVSDLFDAVPWGYELDAMQALFDRIPADERELRDAAFHLLWHARELCLDREPLTRDALKA